jgi:hypothetical protein
MILSDLHVTIEITNFSALYGDGCSINNMVVGLDE